ncbi:MAG: exodeoxyribonuclease VII large subunit [Deltaproteobacteria bacterium]|nr:exodeoxyribonuclease VII large subunit [Deltaproteobacteria bacterium]
MGPVEAEKYTVAGLVGEINDVLSGEFEDVWVEGEIGGFKVAASGHWYFSLKDQDDDAVLNCAMFAGANRSVRKRPKDGDVVLLRGGIDVYAPRGSFSLKVRRLEYTGAGELARKLEELRQKLTAEGLFDPARKRPLPQYPRAVGVVTSPTGAALHDILRVMHGRWPGLPVYLAPCRVQGDGAAQEIAAAVKLLNAHARVDVILVGRGGGSAEDLFCFNEEIVVRAVAASGIPTVSCVGHEVDVTLCDFAADVRAATPSNAAEIVTPERDALSVWVDERHERLVSAMQRRVRVLRDRLVRVRLQHPRQRVERYRQRQVELGQRLAAAIARRQERRRERLAALSRQLDALSPLKVLDRGYAIALHEGHPVVDAKTLKAGDEIDLRFAKGRATAVVKRSAGLF